MFRIFCLLLLPVQLFAVDFSGVYGLIERRVPWMQHHVVFKEIKGKDIFSLETKNGQLLIGADNPNAAAVGLNYYLKHYCKRSMSHMGDNLSSALPLVPVVKGPVMISAAAQYRYALNYCTYNYTMSFYDWKDWEHELDWMALNGVNVMLVANGEEAVWQNTLKRLNYSEKEISDYITGPAYNAWWLMGNIQGWGGPMLQKEIDARKLLTQKMIARMKLLGISPVMPAFYGMVPSTLKDKIKAHIINQSKWGAFVRPDILDPTDTAFARIGGIFYEETQRIYGKDLHFFSGDPFHEGGISDGVDLGKAGANIQKVMQLFFPGAIWVLQGWQDNPRKELLAETDRSTLLVQELFGENTNNWEKRNEYEHTPFIWCTVTNFGERPGLSGKLQRFADEVYRASKGQYMKGVGIMPEGINNNPVTYELLLELGWHIEHVDVAEWISDYTAARYGKDDARIDSAWHGFLNTIYSNPGYQEGPPENILCARPALQIKSVSSWGNLKKGYDTAVFANAVQLFESATCNSETYKIDLINFKRQVLANRADKVFADFADAYHKKDTLAFNQSTKAFLHLHDLTNALLDKHPYYRLTTYQQQAKRYGNLMNAMMLITYWGENDHSEDHLHDYAYKEWSGMMETFYKKRWQLYFDYLKGIGKEPNWFTWEREWVKNNSFL